MANRVYTQTRRFVIHVSVKVSRRSEPRLYFDVVYRLASFSYSAIARRLRTTIDANSTTVLRS